MARENVQIRWRSPSHSKPTASKSDRPSGHDLKSCWYSSLPGWLRVSGRSAWRSWLLQNAPCFLNFGEGAQPVSHLLRHFHDGSDMCMSFRAGRTPTPQSPTCHNLRTIAAIIGQRWPSLWRIELPEARQRCCRPREHWSLWDVFPLQLHCRHQRHLVHDQVFQLGLGLHGQAFGLGKVLQLLAVFLASVLPFLMFLRLRTPFHFSANLSNAAKHCGTWWLLVSIRTHRPWSWKHVVLVIHEVPFEDRTASRLEPVTAGQQGWVHLEPTANEGTSLLLSSKQQSDDKCDSDDSGQTTGPTLC